MHFYLKSSIECELHMKYHLNRGTMKDMRLQPVKFKKGNTGLQFLTLYYFILKSDIRCPNKDV